MTTLSTRLVVVCSVMLLGAVGTTTGSAQRLSVGSNRPVNLFRERIALYTQLRNQVSADLLQNGMDDVVDGDGVEFRRRLGFAIRDARRQSRPGEIFCAEVAGRMRQMVWNALLDADDILSEVPVVPDVSINDFYPDGEPLATVPPSLLRQFEPLPEELQYRFLGTALILLDVDTALIVDYIPNAFQRGS